MNEITLERFIDDMVVCQNANREDAKLLINLTEEEVEGFLDYPRLVEFFKQRTPKAWAQLEAWFAIPYPRRNLNDTPFINTTALDPSGTVKQPTKLIFFYVENNTLYVEAINWISESLSTIKLSLGPAENGWKVGPHHAMPFEEIKTGYLVPIYLDGVAPPRSADLTLFLLQQTAVVIDSPAGRAWIEKTNPYTIETWQSLGYVLNR